MKTIAMLGLLLCTSCITSPESVRSTGTGGAIAIGSSSGSAISGNSSAPMAPAPPVDLDFDSDLPGDTETVYAIAEGERLPRTKDGETAVFAVANRRSCNRLQKLFDSKNVKLTFDRAFLNPNENTNLQYLCVFKGRHAGKIKIAHGRDGFTVLKESFDLFASWRELGFIKDVLIQ